MDVVDFTKRWFKSKYLQKGSQNSGKILEIRLASRNQRDIEEETEWAVITIKYCFL